MTVLIEKILEILCEFNKMLLENFSRRREKLWKSALFCVRLNMIIKT